MIIKELSSDFAKIPPPEVAKIDPPLLSALLFTN